MSSVARVQARGQVTVPREIREACNVGPGIDLFFVQTGPDSFECKVLPPRQSLLEVIDLYAMEGTAPDLDRLREEMGEQMTREVLSGQGRA